MMSVGPEVGICPNKQCLYMWSQVKAVIKVPLSALIYEVSNKGPYKSDFKWANICGQ